MPFLSRRFAGMSFPTDTKVSLCFRYRNYFQLGDILEQLKMTKTAFTKKYPNAHILTLTQDEMREQLRAEDYNNILSDGEVQFVYLKKQTLKKLLNLDTVKIHC